jgi:hypothetical protein
VSRTDKTRPWRVQEADPFERRWYRWDGRLMPWYRCCSCRTYWCCATEPNRHERRQARHDARRRTRAVVKGDWQACD